MISLKFLIGRLLEQIFPILSPFLEDSTIFQFSEETTEGNRHEC